MTAAASTVDNVCCRIGMPALQAFASTPVSLWPSQGGQTAGRAEDLLNGGSERADFGHGFVRYIDGATLLRTS
jgi:hypothetical protein